MTLVKDRCDLWIKYVCDQWLEAWLNPRSSLRDSTRNMVNRMKAASLLRSEEAWNLQERLKRLSDGFDKMDDVTNEQKYRHEKPEVYMECALVAYQMGDLQEALNLLRVSNSDFPRRFPHKAVSYWLYGCIQWQLPAHSEDAILSWERSMQILKEVENDTSRSDLTMASNCHEIAIRMKNAIDEASRTNVPPLPPTFGVKSKPASSSSMFSAYEAKLKSIPVYGSISAGDPYAFDCTSENAGIEELELETGRFYKVYNIKPEREIKLNIDSEYFFLKANGESMNNAKPVYVDNGDYVLLLKTMIAHHNDMVAGVIIKEDATATLKRYRIESGGKFLVSESDKSPIRIQMSKEDYIQGVVVAVLKPIDA